MRVALGDTILLTAPLPTRCCTYTIPAGDTITICKREFPDRPAKKLRAVFVACTQGQHAPPFNSWHKVRTSKIQGEKL